MINPALVASSQSHLDIEDIRDNLVVLKDGSCCLVLQTNAVNFSLLSESEQDATIYSSAGLLNSLTFSVQLVINSQKKDINSYLALLNAQKQTVKNPLLKTQLEKYYRYIQTIVQENEVLEKRFYLVIPFSSLELGISSALGSAFKKRSAGLPFPLDHILQKAKNSLFPKRDHLISQLSRLGLKASQLTTPELIKLFYQAYNPDSGSVDFPANTGYTNPLVSAAINPLPPEPARKEAASETKNPA